MAVEVLTNKTKEDEGIGFLYNKEGEKVPVSVLDESSVNTLIERFLANNPSIFSPKNHAATT